VFESLRSSCGEGPQVPNQPKKYAVDPFTDDYFQATVRSLEKIPVNVFICGSEIIRGRKAERDGRRHDIRLFLKARMERQLKRCAVKLGEHRALIRAYSKAVGSRATNLADHEFALAKSKKMDLIIVFPCSPGSFAELGMFCLVDKIAQKMRIFVKRKFRGSKGYLMQGPVKAAEQYNAKVFFVNYSARDHIWDKVKDIVLEAKAKKRKTHLLAH
jgi:hypothetical protein